MPDNCEALRTKLPLSDSAIAFLESLPADRRDELCGRIGDAADTQHEQLNRAIEDAATFVPGPMRRRARKLLLG